LRINGETGDEDLKVDGNIEGPISLPEHRLTVGSGAQLHGKIVAREIVVTERLKAISVGATVRKSRRAAPLWAS